MRAPDLADELLRRVERDQAARTVVPRGQRWPDHVRDECRRVDADNTAFMTGVIAEHGWPGYDLVGESGSHAVWLLVQHADQDPGFQARCLSLLRAAVTAHQARPADLAYLTDRVLVAGGRPQRYGTQPGRPIEDLAQVDERRAEVGLGPHAEYLRSITETSE